MLNKGDEILIKARVKFADECGGMVLAQNDDREFYVNVASILRVGDADGRTYEEGLADAWELSGKIVMGAGLGGYSRVELEEIFNSHNVNAILYNRTAREVMGMVEHWEDKKAREAREIHVGDVVVYKGGSGNKAVVMEKVHKDAGACCRLLWQDGSYGGIFYDTDLEKTGRHIDIEALLNQIGGDE